MRLATMRLGTMRLATIALAAALAMSGSFAFAQAGEGDVNYAAAYDGGYRGGHGYSSYGAIFHFGRHGHWHHRSHHRW
jgi:hypothetical protein